MDSKKKMIPINFFTKQKQTHRYRKQTTVTESDGGREINEESGITRYTL